MTKTYIRSLLGAWAVTSVSVASELAFAQDIRMVWQEAPIPLPPPNICSCAKLDLPDRGYVGPSFPPPWAQGTESRVTNECGQNIEVVQVVERSLKESHPEINEAAPGRLFGSVKVVKPGQVVVADHSGVIMGGMMVPNCPAKYVRSIPVPFPVVR